MTRMAFGQRPDFGNPYPEGIAVGHVDLTGDASGGAATATLLSDGGFLYRFELLHATQDSVQAQVPTLITSHRWATDRSGREAGAFDLSWVPLLGTGSTFRMWRLDTMDLAAVRRFPIGRTDAVGLQTLFTFIWDVNGNTILYDFDIVCSYWRAEALFRPGFLQAFWEAPVVPPVVAR